MKSICMILLIPTAITAYCQSTSAMSQEREPPKLRTGDYFVDFGSPRIDNLSKSYAYSIFRSVQQILIAAKREDGPAFYRATKASKYSETLQMSCKIDRVHDAITLSVSLVRRDSGEIYFVSKQEGSFYSPESILQAFAIGISTSLGVTNAPATENAPPKVGFYPAFGGIHLGPVFYSAGEFAINYEDVLYDIKMTPRLPAEFVNDFEAFRTRKTIEGVVFYGGAAAVSAAFTYWVAVAPNERASLTEINAPTITVGLLALTSLAGITVMADLPYGLLDRLNAWWAKRTF